MRSLVVVTGNIMKAGITMILHRITMLLLPLFAEEASNYRVERNVFDIFGLVRRTTRLRPPCPCLQCIKSHSSECSRTDCQTRIALQALKIIVVIQGSDEVIGILELR
jgi:hypothetical protein